MREPERVHPVVDRDQAVDAGLASSSGRPSYAQAMSAHSVSPPTSGTAIDRSTEPERRDLTPRDVACARCSRSPGSARPRSKRAISGTSPSGRNGCFSSSPQRRAKSRCCSPVTALVAEEDHLPLEQRAVELGEELVVERVGERDPADLGADRRRQRDDREAGVRLRLDRRREADAGGAVRLRCAAWRVLLSVGLRRSGQASGIGAVALHSVQFLDVSAETGAVRMPTVASTGRR